VGYLRGEPVTSRAICIAREELLELIAHTASFAFISMPLHFCSFIASGCLRRDREFLHSSSPRCVVGGHLLQIVHQLREDEPHET
jgi:hypothetical protein